MNLTHKYAIPWWYPIELPDTCGSSQSQIRSAMLISSTYHIDYVFGSKEFSIKLKKLEIGKMEKWLEISDHLPMICEFES